LGHGQLFGIYLTKLNDGAYIVVTKHFRSYNRNNYVNFAN